jgi:hypothetical protein
MSPTWFDGGRGFSRPRFAKTNPPKWSLRTPHGVGISLVPDLTAGAIQSHPRRIDADSEYGRDFCKSVSLNVSQQKHLAMSLGQFQSSQDRALKGSGLLQS